METFIWGFSWKKLKALEKPDLRGSYGLERTSGCFYRQDLALLRGYFTCRYLLPDALVTMCSLSPPLGYFGKHSREKGLRSFLYSKSVIWDLTFRYHSVQSLSRVRLCDPMDCSTPGLPVHHQPQSLLKLMSIESAMPSNHLILCHPFLLPSIFPSIRFFSKESALHIRWPDIGVFSFNISPSNEHSGLISFRIDWLDFLAV